MGNNKESMVVGLDKFIEDFSKGALTPEAGAFWRSDFLAIYNDDFNKSALIINVLGCDDFGWIDALEPMSEVLYGMDALSSGIEKKLEHGTLVIGHGDWVGKKDLRDWNPEWLDKNTPMENLSLYINDELYNITVLGEAEYMLEWFSDLLHDFRKFSETEEIERVGGLVGDHGVNPLYFLAGFRSERRCKYEGLSRIPIPRTIA